MKPYAFSFLLLLSLSLSAQYSRWEWVTSQTSAASNEIHRLTRDPFGDVIVAGRYTGEVYPWPGDTFESIGSYDLLLSKYTGEGVPKWVRTFGGFSYEEIYGLATDSMGNIYAAGHFESDTLYADTSRLGSSGSANGYLVKFDSAGQVIWMRGLKSTGVNRYLQLAVDAAGNAWVTGFYTGANVTFGGTVFPSTNALGDVFVAKYLPDGTEAWARTLNGTGTDAGQAIAADREGNVYVSGRTNSQTLNVQGGPSISNPGGFQIFLAKYGPNGGVAWARVFGGRFSDEATGLATDSSGNLYMAAQSNSDTLRIDSLTLTPGTSDQVVVFRFDSAGTAIWGRHSATGSFNTPDGISVNDAGQIAIGGYFAGNTIQFGTIILNRINTSFSDAFVVTIDSSGTWLWGASAGSRRDDRCQAVALAPDGKVYAGGFFQEDIAYFGALTLVNAINPLQYDAWVGRVGPSTTANEPQTDFHLSVYPNPSQGSVRVQLPEQAVDLEVFALDGKRIAPQKLIPGPEVTVDLPAPGWYLIRVTDRQGRPFTAKVWWQ
jgi:hypothetical protein